MSRKSNENAVGFKERAGSFFKSIRDGIYEIFRKIFYPRGVKSRKAKTMKRGARIFLVVMLTIPILHWFVFWLYVNFNSILMAFQVPIMGSQLTLRNFQTLFLELGSPTSEIMISLRNTFIYFFTSVLIIMPSALFLSYFYYKKIFGYKVIRVILYLPAIISGVAMTAAYSEILKPSGPLGFALKAMGVDPVPALLKDARYATWTIVVYNIWTGIGTGTLLYQGAMARIPVEVLEASRLDGCKAGREFFQLILPLISPTITTQLILTFTGILSASGPILLFTNGGHQTSTISFWIFAQIKYYGNLNAVAATGLFFTLISVPVILFIRWLLEKIPVVEY